MNLLFVFFLLIVLFLFVFGILLFTAAASVAFSFDSNSPRMNLTVLWLPPLIHAEVLYEEDIPLLSVYVLGGKVYERVLQAGKHRKKIKGLKSMKLIRNISVRDVNAQASYGFLDPMATGIACGIINILLQFIDIGSIYQDPDFITDRDYVYVHATAKVNIGLTLVNLIRAYFGGSTRRLSYQNR